MGLSASEGSANTKGIPPCRTECLCNGVGRHLGAYPNRVRPERRLRLDSHAGVDLLDQALKHGAGTELR